MSDAGGGPSKRARGYPAHHVITGDCVDSMRKIGGGMISLIFTSPPYNIGKEYEKRVPLATYIAQMTPVAAEMARVLRPGGHLCWQVGNHVDNGKVVPLDMALHPTLAAAGFVLQRRFLWTFGHGLHCQKRFSGRYETIVWYTKGPRTTELRWPIALLREALGRVIDAPNVKSNHVEKRTHPCPFPVELPQRFVLALTNPGDMVLDPFGGSGTTAVASLLAHREPVTIDCVREYSREARARLAAARAGTLPIRPMGKDVHEPTAGSALTQRPAAWDAAVNPALEQEKTHVLCGTTPAAPPDLTLRYVPRGTRPASIPEAGTCCLIFEDETGDLDMSHELLPFMTNRVICSYATRYTVVCCVSRGDPAFHLDAVRVPSKYPGKRSVRTGELSGNPLGKNPGDFWDDPAPAVAAGLSEVFLTRLIRAYCPVGGIVDIRDFAANDAGWIRGVAASLRRNTWE